MPFPFRVRFAVSVALVSIAAGCAAGEDFDSGAGEGGTDSGAAVDARGDVGFGTDVSRTDVPFATDVPRDIASDVSRTDVRTGVDTVIPPTDTGGRCVDTCTFDSDCQSSCPAAASGHSQCCAFNTCTEVSQPVCPSSTDAGSSGSDTGIPSFDAAGVCLMRSCTTGTDCASCGTGWRCLGLGTTHFCIPPA